MTSARLVILRIKIYWWNYFLYNGCQLFWHLEDCSYLEVWGLRSKNWSHFHSFRWTESRETITIDQIIALDFFLSFQHVQSMIQCFVFIFPCLLFIFFSLFNQWSDVLCCIFSRAAWSASAVTTPYISGNWTSKKTKMSPSWRRSRNSKWKQGKQPKDNYIFLLCLICHLLRQSQTHYKQLLNRNSLIVDQSIILNLTINHCLFWQWLNADWVKMSLTD